MYTNNIWTHIVLTLCKSAISNICLEVFMATEFSKVFLGRQLHQSVNIFSWCKTDSVPISRVLLNKIWLHELIYRTCICSSIVISLCIMKLPLVHCLFLYIFFSYNCCELENDLSWVETWCRFRHTLCRLNIVVFRLIQVLYIII